MSIQVTVTLTDEIYDRAQRLAQLTGKSIEDILASSIRLSLPALGTPEEGYMSLETLSDSEIMALTELEMDENDDQKFSELLNKQQAGTLKQNEQTELAILMQLYQEGLLRKAQALRVAVDRGLRKPLEP